MSKLPGQERLLIIPTQLLFTDAVPTQLLFTGQVPTQLGTTDLMQMTCHVLSTASTPPTNIFAPGFFRILSQLRTQQTRPPRVARRTASATQPRPSHFSCTQRLHYLRAPAPAPAPPAFWASWITLIIRAPILDASSNRGAKKSDVSKVWRTDWTGSATRIEGGQGTIPSWRGVGEAERRRRGRN